MDALEVKLAEVTGELKALVAKYEDQIRSTGAATEELKQSVVNMQRQVDAIDAKICERDAAAASSSPAEWKTAFTENESFNRLMRDRSGRAVVDITPKQYSDLMERKTTITSDALGRMTSGVLPIDRYAGIVPEARQTLKLRNVLTSRPTNLAVVDFVKTNSISLRPTNSPQTEGNTKYEGAATFTTASERVQTLAVFIPATRQSLDDLSELMGYLQTALPYYVDLEEEIQMLSGDGTGVNLNGLITVATAFTTSLRNASQYASKGYYWMDDIARAQQQIAVAKEVEPTFFVVHPTDWWNMRLQKDTQGRYLLGDPNTNVVGPVFGLTPVITTSITAGTWLVGSGQPAATEIRDRMGMTVEISTEDSTNFQKNLITIRAEKRLALVTRRRGSFITGSFASSPA